MAGNWASSRRSPLRTNGRDGGDNFAQLELVQDGSFSSCVQTNHQNSHLLLAPEAVKQLRERETHDGGAVGGV